MYKTLLMLNKRDVFCFNRTQKKTLKKIIADEVNLGCEWCCVLQRIIVAQASFSSTGTLAKHLITKITKIFTHFVSIQMKQENSDITSDIKFHIAQSCNVYRFKSPNFLCLYITNYSRYM